MVSKSVTAERIKANNKIMDLEKEDMETLEDLHKQLGLNRTCKPAWPMDFEFEAWDQSEYQRPF